MKGSPQNNFADKPAEDASPSDTSAPTARRVDPPGARLFSKAQIAEAETRRAVLQAALPFFESSSPQNKVARLLGISPATLSRLLNLCPAKGNAARNAAAKCQRLLSLPVSRLAPKAALGGRESDALALVQVAAVVRHLATRCDLHLAAGHAPASCIRSAIQDLGYFHKVPMAAARRLRQGWQPKPLRGLLASHVAGKDRLRRKPDPAKN
jgi:hypothetical protein